MRPTGRRKVRTQVQIDPEVYTRLRAEANRRDVSTSFLVREALCEHYGKGRKPRDVRKALAAIRRFAGCIKGDPPDVAVNHDKYLADAMTSEGW